MTETASTDRRGRHAYAPPRLRPPRTVVPSRRCPSPTGPADVLVEVPPRRSTRTTGTWSRGCPCSPGRPGPAPPEALDPRRRVAASWGPSASRSAARGRRRGVRRGRGGGFAEYVVAPADAGRQAREPRVRAGGHPRRRRPTALQGLRDWAVCARAGACWSTARPAASARSRSSWPRRSAPRRHGGVQHPHVETAAQIGADRVVDYTGEDATEHDASATTCSSTTPGSGRCGPAGRMLALGRHVLEGDSPQSRWLQPLPRMLANPLYFKLAPGTVPAQGRRAQHRGPRAARRPRRPRPSSSP